MDEKHRAHDEQGERLEIPHILFAVRSDMHADAGVRVGMLRCDPSRDRLHLRPRLLDRDAFLHFADAIEEEISARMIFLLKLKRHPNVADLREAPAFRHDADYGDLLAVDWNGLADNALVAGEMFLPNLIADECDRRRVQLIFFRSKESTENRRHPPTGK